MGDVAIRLATADDIGGLTSVKTLWADLSEQATPASIAEFQRTLAEWITARHDTLHIAAAEDAHELVGMAWLVVFEGVPNIHEGVSTTGDTQSVFVRPGHRGQGIARALVAALLSAADAMNIPRVTVSANEAVARVYLNAGFAREENLLERRMRKANDR